MASSHLFLQDNSTSSIRDAGGDESSIRNLSLIDGKTLEDLENDGVLLFPPSVVETGYSSDSGPLISLGIPYGETSPDRITVTTGNLMGFISAGNTSVSITSRFTRNRDEDYFLQYMLSRIYRISLVGYLHSFSSSYSFFDIYPLLFAGLLKKAMKKGIYRSYVRREYNSSSPRGVVDVKRHIRENTPFLGKVAYTVREYTYDNSVTELIRHTVEYIERSTPYKGVLSIDSETEDYVRKIRECTSSYTRNGRLSVMNENRRRISHPYYMEYEPLRKLCLMILRHERISYNSDGEGRIYGIVFDGAWLWEEYLAAVLEDYSTGYTHSSNIKGTGGLNVYSGCTLYPDFYKVKGRSPDDVEYNRVLDAKYKRAGSFDRTDLFQLVTYMHILPSIRGALIKPVESDTTEAVTTKQHELHGFGGRIAVITFPVPQNTAAAEDFSDYMRKVERSLARVIEAF